MRWPWQPFAAWWRRQRWSVAKGLSAKDGPLGAIGEEAAARYLCGLGYRIIGRGVRAGRGELDLVAIDQRTVVIVEVKTQRSLVGGHPAERVDDRKQRLICRTALQYLKQRGWLEHRLRFDVIAIVWPHGADRPTVLQHYRHAFELPPDMDG
jgi:putative endonuclease